MAKKNSDSKSFNRTGIIDVETMKIQYEDKEGIKIFDLGSELRKYDGLEVSISVTTDIPASPISDEEE